jgi:class 3 adenylate cyclase
MSRGGTEFLFALCDISGYTRFMTEHREALFHSYVIISQLMRAVVQEAKAPLRVMKLEGDAAFLYAPQVGGPEARQETARAALSRLHQTFSAFAAKRQELLESNICACQTCTNVDQLRLKVIVHSGAAVFHRIGRHSDLSGPDVILAHRLLKNSVEADEYLLLTEAAQRDLGPPTDGSFSRSEEQYEGFGAVKTFVYPPPSDPGTAAAGHYGTPWLKTTNILRKIFHGRAMQLRLVPRPRFHHPGQ